MKAMNQVLITFSAVWENDYARLNYSIDQWPKLNKQADKTKLAIRAVKTFAFTLRCRHNDC